MKKHITLIIILILITTLTACVGYDEIKRIPSPNNEYDLIIVRNNDDVATVASYLSIHILPSGRETNLLNGEIFRTAYAHAEGEWIDEDHIKIYLGLDESKEFIQKQIIVYQSIKIEYEYIINILL